MAENRDMIDDIIDIQRDWKVVSNPFGDIANSLALDPNDVQVYDPSDYKARPRINSLLCLCVASGDKGVCHRCFDVCPVDAITIKGNAVKISDSCRKCGLCSMACPTEAFVTSKLMAKGLYDKIARAASEYENCYVTCTRALGRIPKPNEILLPCVGAVPRELWFSLLYEYGNINVYLPLGICDRCRTTTGEEAYAEEISAGEELSHGACGLEVDEAALTHEQSRDFKRGQFYTSMKRAGTAALATMSPGLTGAVSVAGKLKQRSEQMVAMQRSLERAVGAKTESKHRRILTQKRKVMLTTIQAAPELANSFRLKVPSCDTSLCTACGDCVAACVDHACELDSRGHFSVEPAYCINCGACAKVCPEGALSMVGCAPADLVVVDEEAERRHRAAEKQRAKVAKTKAEGRKRLNKVLDSLERLDDE